MASGKSAEFSPAELDRIEDAIEALEDGELPDGLTNEMDDRLQEYQQILRLSREALPLEEVPEGVLDGVIEEARAAAAAPEAEPAAAAEHTGVFRRLSRAFLLPTLALAGSAALVLWMVRPKEEPASDRLARAPLATERASVGEKDEARPFPGLAEQSAEGTPRLADAEMPAADEPVEELEQKTETARGLGALGKEKELDGALDKRGPPAAKPSPRKKAKKSSGKNAGYDPLGGGGLPEPQPQQPAAPPPASKQDKGKPATDPADETSAVMKNIDRGDSYRRADRCDLARVAYKNALGTISSLSRGQAASANEMRARAHAGIGLCDEWEGDQKAAAARFDRARKAWAGIEAFIRQERSRGYRGGASSKRKAKQKAAPKAAEDAFDDDYN
jgi:hypothetical protein